MGEFWGSVSVIYIVRQVVVVLSGSTWVYVDLIKALTEECESGG